jgi:hypothetical protein
MKKKISKISTMSWSHEKEDKGLLVAVCDDGSVWMTEYSSLRGFGGWLEIDEYPEDIRKTKKKD